MLNPCFVGWADVGDGAEDDGGEDLDSPSASQLDI